MPKISFKITGADEIIAALLSVAENTREQVIWPATVEAAEVIRDAARENAHAFVDDPSTATYIPENIKTARRIKKGREQKAAIVSVGVVSGRGTGNNTWYWWWLELGSRNTRPRAFLRKAAFHNVDRVFSTFYQTADYELTKLVRNLKTYRSGKFPNIRATNVDGAE